MTNKGNRAEDIKTMSKLEIEVNAKIASELYDKFTIDTKANIIPKEAFILGYLHGMEKVYNEIGMNDDKDDFSKLYDFLEENVNRFQK